MYCGDSSRQWAVVFVAWDSAKTSPSGANSLRSRGSRKHLGCGCGSAEGDEGNEPVPAWSCNPVSARWKPRSASHIQLRNRVHIGFVWILYVCSIYISAWCSIELHWGHLGSISHCQRYFLTRLSQAPGEGQSQCAENVTPKAAKGRQGNKYCNLDAIQDAVQNERLAGLHQPRDRYFQGVSWSLQHSRDPLDVALDRTDSSIRSLATVFFQAPWTST